MFALLLLPLACKSTPEPLVPSVPSAPTPDPPTLSVCGDGIVDPETERCDDGVNDGAYGGCADDCSALGPHCGDAALQANEVCDNGDNVGAYGGCEPGCTDFGPRCGDGQVDDSEACDDGINDGSYGGCATDCESTARFCGDGVVDPEEVCDDGVNDGAYGGCTESCEALAGFCGDGVVDAEEVCDDGVNDGTYGGCASSCQVRGRYCGDGVNDPEEVCDDGENLGAYEGCEAGCQAVSGYCGDGVVDPEEACDDGVNDWLGGGCKPGCESEDLSDGVYALDRVLEIDIVLDPADWESLRNQKKGRHTVFAGEDCLDRPIGTPSPYTWFAGDVRIDGQPVGTVGVKKKGHIGSQWILKPSLKLDFAEYDEDLRWESMKRLTLNNDVSDQAHLHQCMTYQAFRNAGLPAARCNYAHVTVNGEDLGIYSNIEPMKKAMLRYHLGNGEGNLYEGTVSDFQSKFIDTFQQDLNEEDDPSRSDFQSVTDVLENVDDAGLVAALEPLIDLEHLYRYWAMETLAWHHDSFSGNTNNYYIYGDPNRGGRLIWLPWGTDHAFHTNTNVNLSDTGRIRSLLLERLYMLPETQERYFEVLLEMASSDWDTEQLGQALDAHVAVLETVLPADELPGLSIEAEIIRDFIDGRQQVMLDALTDGPPELDSDLRSSPCLRPAGSASVYLEDSGWSEDGLGVFELCPNAEVDLTVDGVDLEAGVHSCRSGFHTNDRHYFQSRSTNAATDTRYTVSIAFPAYRPEYFGPGTWLDTGTPWSLTVVERDLEVNANTRRWDIGGGTIVVHEYDMIADAPVSISVDGTLWQTIEF